MDKKGLIARIVALIMAVPTFFGLKYLTMAAVSIRSIGLWGVIIATVAIELVIQLIIEYAEAEEYYFTLGSGALLILLTIAFIICNATGAEMFNAMDYQSLATIEAGEFEQEITSNVSNNLAVVDLDSAKMLGSRSIGELKNSTWYEIDNEYNLITYQGEEYRISPLNYGGMMKYHKAKNSGIPGYVMVNAVTQEAKYIELEKPMYYSPSAMWGNKLKRHLRQQYSSYIFGKSFFEIDEEGNPYWITAVKTPTIGVFDGMQEEKFIITDACSGESKEYDVDELPTWVDHAFELDYLMGIAEYNLHYIHGWKNFHFGKTDVRKLSYEYRGIDSFKGYNSTKTKDGIQFFTGVTPANNSESNLGFVLINTRTGKIKYFECPGAEESTAQSAAESIVQNFGYEASHPTIINMDGVPTYFMVLKDKAQLIQRYAFVNVSNYSIVVAEETLEKAISAYREKMGFEVAETLPEEKTVETLSTKGTISKIEKADVEGTTYFYFRLEESDDIYVSSIKNSSKQVFLEVGTKIEIEYHKSSESSVYSVTKITIS